MITEIAHIMIDPAQAAEFETAVERASAVLRQAQGSRSMVLERVIEDPGEYRLRVEWDSVEHHMVTFRESELFKQWRAIAGPFFAAPPRVEHSETVGRFF